MSAFEVTITPPRSRNAKRQETHSPTVVYMAPFSAKSLVEFQDVPISKTAKRILRIMNPTEQEIEVSVSKPIPSVYNLTAEWSNKTVPPLGEVEMELTWTPQMILACKEKMQLIDDRNFRKDVEIILKSKSNQTKVTNKFPTLSSSSSSSSSSFVKTLRLKPPKNNMKVTKRINNTSCSAAYMQQEKLKANTRSQSNAAAVEKGGKVSSTTSTTCNRQPLIETNVQCSKKSLPVNEDKMSKENISPVLSPNVVLEMLDNLNFTPTAAIKSQIPQHSVNNLTFLPTPVGITITPAPDDHRQLKPRKLTVNDLDALSTPSNKTFVVNELNLTQDLMDASTSAINRTTTIQSTPMARTLDMICEEETDPGITQVLTNTTILSLNKNNKDLKRDIKLVGTPLRKYSESMQDLLSKSPQNKIAIQGSMPNLNEMETIRSIEQNRYFHQSGSQMGINDNKKRMSTVLEQSSPSNLSATENGNLITNLVTTSRSNIASSIAELDFDLQEIAAQSSRFNLNEVGLSKRNATTKSPNNRTLNKINKTISPRNSGAIKKVSSKEIYDRTIAGKKRSLTEVSPLNTKSPEFLKSNNESFKLGVQRANSCTAISPPKRLKMDTRSQDDYNFVRPTPGNISQQKDWSRTQPKKCLTFSTYKKTFKSPPKIKREQQPQRIQLYNPDSFLQSFINPDPFAATTTCDPFLASTMYLDPQAVERHQTDFRKWLNALVTIPEDFDADSNTKIDVGRLFNEVRNKELTLAPTKEEQSMNYLTKFRLDSLRRAAIELFMSEELRIPCSKIAVYVTKQTLRIRQDRNLHLDVVMQRQILELLLCFNPLWLRLGLEVVFGEQIHLHSNRDVVGLSTFILNRLFRDRFLEQKHSKAFTLSEEYANTIKKFTLQKVLFLLLFLDKAKTKRIIKHNPCLFVKKSPHKETKEILLRFSSELLANVGDITRDLKRLGYVLHHKQAYIDEFDYAFNNLAIDLRDGVRLTKVMEIILLRDDLTQQLRVPAISRLQRLFNVNLALNALSEADFQLNGNITAADIVDGHREKTLSLLWQIIYKFRAPKFHSAARIIQTWWRKNWLRITIRRRIQQKEMQRREKAAIKIQAIFRAFLARQYFKAFKTERIEAAIILQKYIRRYLVQKHLVQQNNAAIIIQRYYRAYLLKRECRQEYLRLRECTILVQRIFRRRLLCRKLLLAAAEAKIQREQKRNAAAAYIQTYWQAYKEMRIVRTEYLHLRQTVVNIQQRYRARLQMHHDRAEFIKLCQTVIFVQQKFKAKQLMRQQRQVYLAQRMIIIKLQRRCRAQLQMRAELQAYQEKRAIIIKLQQRLRATWVMKAERDKFQQLRASACIIQQRYRARLAMKKDRAQYQHIRDAVIIIQRKWRATMLARRIQVDFITLQYATIILQQKFRARKQMKKDRLNYLELRTAAITIQRRYRAKLEMIKVRKEYQYKMQSIITLQRHYRAYKEMRFQRAKFQGTRNAVICLQQHIRAYLIMKQKKIYYQNLKTSTIVIQRLWRAKLQMREERLKFEQLKTVTINIQRRYRGKLEMRREMLEYQRKRQLIIAIQRRFRGKLLTRKMQSDYRRKLSLIIYVQRRFRANHAMLKVRRDYINKRESIIKIQKYFRSYLLMKSEKEKYQQKRFKAIKIQCWYRSLIEMRQQKSKYQELRSKVIFIQQKWRAKLAARKQRSKYLNTLEKIIFIQRKFRATLKMKAVCAEYQQKKSAAIILQRHYRAHLEMLKIRSQYQLIISLTICIQRKFRARKMMRIERERFLLLKRTVIHLQQKFRGKRIMLKERTVFLNLRQSIPNFQACARGYLARRRFEALMTPEMIELLRQKRAAKTIQRFYRGYLVRKRLQNTCIQAIRQNLKASKETANIMNTIQAKLVESVRILRDSLNMSEMLNVLQRLDRLSRCVPHLFKNHSDFIATFCYGIMAQAIRSEIDKKMIECCSRIILNLARYDCVTLNTFQKGGLVTIAQMLLRWCDKESEIFNTLCTLVWIFAHCNEKRRIIREFMVTPEAIYMLRETKKLVARKEKMKLNRRQNVLLTSNKNQFSSRSLPSLEPDYGIIQNKPYTFVSSVYAFDTLLCKLNVDVY